MTDDYRPEMLRRAIRLACDSVESGGGPFGAIVVLNGEVVAEGSNRVTVANDPTAHAEIVAIREACAALSQFDLRGASLYTSCEPCPMCLGAIHWARLDRIYFAADRHDAARAGFDDELLYREIALAHDERVVRAEQHLQSHGEAPFAAWRVKTDRTEY